MHFHNTATQSRSAWTEQEDELLRQAVAKFGDRAWATVANDVPGRSSKSCSDRWRNFLSPDIEHPRKSPFTEWEVAVVVQAQGRYGNNWKAISMLLPGRTNRAVKNLFVGNLKWGARLSEIRNRWLESNMSLEELLEIKPDHAGGPVKLKPGMTFPTASGSPPSSFRAASTSSAGSAWASDMTDQPLSGSPASAGTVDRRKRADGLEVPAGQTPSPIKRRRGAPSPVMVPQHYHSSSASYSPNVVPHPGAFGPGLSGSPILAGLPGGLANLGVVSGMGPPGPRTINVSTPTLALGLSSTGEMMAVKQRVSSNGSGDPFLLPNMQAFDQGSPSLAAAGGFVSYNRVGAVGGGRSSSMSALQGMPSLLLPGQLGVADNMVNRIHSWHPSSVAPGMDVAVAAAAAPVGNGSSSPFAALAGDALLSPPSSRGMSNLNPMRGVLKAEQGLDPIDCSGGPVPFSNLQQTHCWAADLAAQQQMGQLQQQHQLLSQQQTAQLQQPEQQQNQMNGSDCQQQGVEQGPSAALGPQAAIAAGIGLLPGSPTQLLQDMRSNDSAAFQQMLEQIFDEDADDICISDPQTMNKLDGMMGAQQGPAAQLQPVAAGQQGAGQVVDSSAHTAASGLEASSNAPQRSNTWPNTWPDVAADGQGPTAVPAAAHAGGSCGGAAPTHHAPSPINVYPTGDYIPARSMSATGSGLNPAAAAAAHLNSGPVQAQQQQQQEWAWGPYAPPGAPLGMPGHHSMPGSVPGSGPPSNGGGFMPQQDMQALCHQLQQENMKLMAHVSKLQHRLNSHPNELPGPPDAAGINVNEGPVGSVAPAAPDSDLPRLPPVRVGGSSGGAAAVGAAPAAAASWGVGVLGHEGAAGLDGTGSGGLGGLGVDLSPDGTFTPGGLLGDSNDGDLLSGI